MNFRLRSCLPDRLLRKYQRPFIVPFRGFFQNGAFAAEQKQVFTVQAEHQHIAECEPQKRQKFVAFHFFRNQPPREFDRGRRREIERDLSRLCGEFRQRAFAREFFGFSEVSARNRGDLGDVFAVGKFFFERRGDILFGKPDELEFFDAGEHSGKGRA